MTFKKITIITSAPVIMPEENIDTDQIIPARFLKTTSREGFGENLFYDLRHGPDGTPVQGFPLNDLSSTGRPILVAGRNFGCGSSREHAAWAIAGHGFRVVVSSFFADIFRNNALNNGILPVQVSEGFLQNIFTETAKDPLTEVRIDLSERRISIPKIEDSEIFEINGYKRHCMMNGLDDIDFLVAGLDEITQYERKTNAL